MEIQNFIQQHSITMTAEYTDTNPNMIADEWAVTADHWKCVFTRRENGKPRRMTTYFSMGSGHNGHEPEAGDVLDSLASDASGIENARGFEDWASEYGYDTDSRKAERIYRNCQRAAVKLKKFLGSDVYESLLWNTERL